jgi:NAD(P)-dependent dehydrogenase (short-subunit alcohol dehydrogenase family)
VTLARPAERRRRGGIRAAGRERHRARRDDDDDEADLAVAAVARHKLDVLVNNAGIDDDTPFLDIDRARWHDVVTTNLTGPFLMSQAAARSMQGHGRRRSSHNASIDASGGARPFAASISGRVAGAELGRGDRAGAVRHPRRTASRPGSRTQMTESAVGRKLMEYQRQLRAGADAPPGAAVGDRAGFAFLASERRVGITGINLTVDCGLTGQLVHPRNDPRPMITEHSVGGWRAITV